MRYLKSKLKVKNLDFINLIELEQLIEKKLLNLGINPTNADYQYFNDYNRSKSNIPSKELALVRCVQKF